MKRFSIEGFMRRISIIPGLSFLERWVTEFRGVRTSIDQRVGDLQAYKDAAVDGASDVVNAAGSDRPSRAPSDEPDYQTRDFGDGHDDDYEEEDYDWEDY